jgi:hypothetical protein
MYHTILLYHGHINGTNQMSLKAETLTRPSAEDLIAGIAKIMGDDDQGRDFGIALVKRGQEIGLWHLSGFCIVTRQDERGEYLALQECWTDPSPSPTPETRH